MRFHTPLSALISKTNRLNETIQGPAGHSHTDPAIKIYVKTHFYLGEDVTVTSWFHLVFIENNGMAFGMELVGKLFLTLFRVALAGALIWYIWKIRNYVRVTAGYIVCLALIVPG